MKLTELLLADLEREAARSKRALEQVPDGKYDWKPHDKSMIFGYLAQLVATMPSWVTMGVNQNEMDLNPPSGSTYTPPSLRTSSELVTAHDQFVTEARTALSKATDDALLRPWRLLVAGAVVMETPRHVMIRDTMMHLSHHRGQLTVYLRLLGSTVPALYGPSADDKRFA